MRAAWNIAERVESMAQGLINRFGPLHKLSPVPVRKLDEKKERYEARKLNPSVEETGGSFFAVLNLLI